MHKRVVNIAAIAALSALIFVALDLTAGKTGDDLAMAFDHHPAKAPYLCVAKAKPVRPVA